MRILRDNADWLLIAAVLPLFASNSLFNLPIATMAIIALVMLVRGRWTLHREPATRLFVLLFLAFWLPMLLACLDAVNPARSLKTTLTWLRFGLAGIYVLTILARPDRLERLGLFTLVVVGAWSLDGVIQYVFGQNLLGYPHAQLQVNGVFHPNYLLGIMTASLLAPCIAVMTSLAGKARLLLLAAPALPAAILLGANRNSWLMTAVVIAALGAGALLRGWRPRPLPAVLLVLALAAGAGLLIASDDALQRRLVDSAGALSLDAASFDKASGYRLTLWRTAMHMFMAEPLTGVGPRGFRYAYADHAGAGDFWLEHFGRGQTHPHQQVLEIGAETGLPGLAGYLLAWIIIIRLFGRALQRPGYAALGWVTAAGLAVFPLNAHKAFYSSYWSALAWWLLAIAVAASLRQNGRSAED